MGETLGKGEYLNEQDAQAVVRLMGHVAIQEGALAIKRRWLVNVMVSCDRPGAEPVIKVWMTFELD